MAHQVIQRGLFLRRLRRFLLIDYLYDLVRYAGYGRLFGWGADELAGTVAEEVSGRHDGTISGGVTVGRAPLVDDDGRAWDTGGGYVQVADHADLNFGAADSFTALTAFAREGTGGSSERLCRKFSGGVGWTPFIFDDGRFIARVDDGSTDAFASAGVVDDGQLHHGTMVVDRLAQTLTALVDGDASGDVEDISAIGDLSVAAPFEIGASATEFYGQIDGAIIAPDALSESILAHIWDVAQNRNERLNLDFGLPDWATSAGFSADDIEYLCLPERMGWYDFATGVTVPHAASHVSDDGTNLARQTDTSSMPWARIVSGRHALSFEGDDYMEMVDGSGALNITADPPELTWFGVARADVYNPNRHLLTHEHDTTGARIGVWVNSSGDLVANALDSNGNQGFATIDYADVETDSPFVWALQFQASGSPTMRLIAHNGTAQFTATKNVAVTGNFEATDRLIGNDINGSNVFDGPMWLPPVQLNRRLSNVVLDAIIADVAAERL